jgi:hypothetical protein
MSILTALTSSKLHPSPALLLLHYEALKNTQPDANTLCQTARSHYKQHPSNPTLAANYLKLQIDMPNQDASVLSQTCETVIRAITIPNLPKSEKIKVAFCWTSWRDHEARLLIASGGNLEPLWSRILSLSLKLGNQAGLPELHILMLISYFSSMVQRTPQPPIIPTLKRITEIYRPNHTFFYIAFILITIYSSKKDIHNDLGKAYEIWRSASKTGMDKVGAGVEWAKWLVSHGKAKEGARVIDVVRREVGGMDGGEEFVAEVERKWEEILSGAEKKESSAALAEGGDSLDYSLKAAERALSAAHRTLEDRIAEGDERVASVGVRSVEIDEVSMIEDSEDSAEEGEEDEDEDEDYEMAVNA